MVKHILLALFGFIILAFIAIWIIGGGPRRTVDAARESIRSAVTPDEQVGFRLPWQPAELFPNIDITEMYDLSMEKDSSYPTFDYEYEMSQEQQLAELEVEYDRLRAETSRQRTFGTPSRFAGKVTIQQDVSGVRMDESNEEYVQIAANYANAEPIDIAGWTLESALSGIRIQIPPAASPYIANSANIIGPVMLDPGALALVISAPSPIGVSFRENICTGYLGQFQSFSPPLAEECPSPSNVLPLTEENLRRYGDTCFDAIRDLPSCRFPQNIPSDIFPSCRAYLTDALSYNGCISQNRFRANFQKNMWRVYLGSSGEMWRNSHDAIRLIDAEGRTVSVFVY